MKNVTIAIDEETLNAGRQYAMDHHTTLNSLIRQLLERTVSKQSGDNWADEFFKLADKAKGNSEGRQWTREDLYDV